MSASSRTPRLRVFADAEIASRVLAEETAAEIRAAGSRGWSVGLATGNTPLALYRGWIRLHRAGSLSFAAVRCFHLDELWPAPRGASFAEFLEEHLFGQVDLPPGGRVLLDGGVPASAVAAECARYEERIRAAGGLDLQILGLGLNGHIGFNEPGSLPDSRTRRIALAADTRARAAAERPEWAACAEALTIGIATILAARRIVVLAFGAAKAAAVARALEGEESAAFPASFLRRHAQTTWILDEAAAAGLTRARE